MPPPLVALQDATATFGGRPLFEHVSVAIGRGDKLCLVGRNGSGKSTLLRLLAGEAAPDGGGRFLQPGARIGHLAQEAALGGHTTVGAFVAAGLPALEADARFKVEAMLDRFGLSPERPLEQLSGGKLRRAALAQVLVGEPDVLLLDEPTNHLDLATIGWLEQTLLAWRGGLIVISHDRAFLRALTQRTVWLDRGCLREHTGSFAAFEAWQDEVFAVDAAAAHRLDRKIVSETKWLREGLSARRTRNMGRVRALQTLRAERADRQVNRQVRLAAAEGEAGGRMVIEAERISKAFVTSKGMRTLVRDFSTRILRGDRVGLIGRNGAGKTTLLRMLTGQLEPDSGSIRIGTGVLPAYFDQRRTALDPAASLRQTLCPLGGDQVMVGGRPRHVASYLKDFLFDSHDLDTPVRVLSGGERNRLLLAALFARPSNLLILDEPTNDLDMETLDLLEEVLADYEGTLLLVSHDRDFLDRLVTSVIAVEGDGTVGEYPGGYTDYLAQSAAGAAASAGSGRGPGPAGPGSRGAAGGPGAAGAESGPSGAPRVRRKLGYREQRELDSLPQRLEALNDAVIRLEATLADPGLYQRDRAGFETVTRALDEARRDLVAAEERWLELEVLRESLEAGADGG